VGYGQDTDYAPMRAYDMLIQAESGLCSVTGTNETACKVGVSAADIAAGMNAHAAILEALLERAITGKGKSIEISMFDSLADWMNVPLLHYDHLGKETPRVGLSHAAIYPYRPFSCSDGVVIVVVQNPGEWSRLCQLVLEKPELEVDPRFASNPLRVENRKTLDQEMEPIFAAMTRQQAVDRLDQANLASAKLCDIKDLSEHPALRRVEAEANGKSFTLAAPPLHPHIGITTVPGIGEHTQQVVDEFS